MDMTWIILQTAFTRDCNWSRRVDNIFYHKNWPRRSIEYDIFVPYVVSANTVQALNYRVYNEQQNPNRNATKASDQLGQRIFEEGLP